MRLFILGFLIGVSALQMQAALPLIPAVHIAGIGLAATLCAWLTAQRRPMFAIMLAAGLAIAGGAGLGFGWAQWRAESRMADTLPRDFGGAGGMQC